MKNYILYHASCYDGMGAAYSAWKYFSYNAEYIPVKHGEPLPALEDGSNVYIIDFSYKKEVLEELNKRMNFLLVLDHHKTAEENLKGLPYAYFDMTKSGAMLAWEHFFPNQVYPLLIEYIQDRDLWQNKLPNTEAIHAALSSYPMDFEVWDKLDVLSLVNEGTILLKYRKQLIDNICKHAYWIEKGGYKFITVNATCLFSDVCHHLLTLYPDTPFSSSYWFDSEGNKIWSLRGRGDFDVSAFAKLYGGGGHANASGFKELMV